MDMDMRRRRSDLDSENFSSTLNMRLKSQLFKEKFSFEIVGKQQLLDSEEGILKYPNIKSRSRMKPLLVWIVTLGVFSTALLRSAIPIYLNVADEKFLELKKCPACYGVMLCPAFLMGDIVPETWSRFKAAQLLNTKNVYFATFKDKHVSYKRLFHFKLFKNLWIFLICNVLQKKKPFFSVAKLEGK